MSFPCVWALVMMLLDGGMRLKKKKKKTFARFSIKYLIDFFFFYRDIKRALLFTNLVTKEQKKADFARSEYVAFSTVRHLPAFRCES
jgi:hypothetical protein